MHQDDKPLGFPSTMPLEFPRKQNVETQFIELCLLVPVLREDGSDKDSSHQRISTLTISLIDADHSAAPSAGLAFLKTMASRGQTAKAGAFSAARLMIAIALYELCRSLEQILPVFPTRPWTIGGILGPEVHTAIRNLSIGRLAAAVEQPDRRSAQE